MAEHRPSPPPSAAGPVLAPLGASAAEASRPETPLEERYHIYESNPAPWWIGAAVGDVPDLRGHIPDRESA